VTFNPVKTCAVLFTNTLDKNDIDLFFADTHITFSESHTHLGVVFSSDLKWNDHIEKIVKSVSKQLSMLRKLKYLLNREALNKLYLTFIRPIFEVASELWDECGIGNSERLEKLQLEGGRIVTGLTSYASRESIYYETGWTPLAERRKTKKLCLM